jgi:polyferredoxin/formate hydrogenlyase subunit 6/NADH:ubiquinone oxidoreductase subunit I
MKLTPARIFQYLFLAVFLFLFVHTEYRGKDEISVAINSFFRTNPLVVLSYLFSVKTLVFILLPGILMLIFSALLGRFFCGWICPLGTTIDLLTRKITKRGSLKFLKGNLKYWLLFVLLGAALFNVNIVGIFDPIAILVRGLTFFLYPLLGHSVRASWAGLYGIIGEHRDSARFLYDFLQEYLLPFRETFYPLGFLSLIFLLLIILLERFEERNWCRNLCPLGTLLGLLSRFSLFRRTPGKLCGDCKDCGKVCPTTFDEEFFQKKDCILCMDCKTKCRFHRVHFAFLGPGRGLKEKLKAYFGGGKRAGDTPVLERRVLLGGLVSGFFLSRVFSFKSPSSQERLLRPPGVKSEGDFLRKCVRCGECMKVCLRSALYPDLARSGLYGLFTPVIIPRLGYCEYNCNLCGQVCPTGAIPNLPLEAKKTSVIGTAVFDKNHCLPYAKKINCIVCEEHCPIPEKAIRFELSGETDYQGRKVILKKPYIVDTLCNGCGICENKCPLEGKSAVEVFAKKK